MKLQLHIDAPEEDDPQSPFRVAVFEAWVRVFARELPLLCPGGLGRDGAEVSVSFVDALEMRDINKKYRDCDEPTDVLAFPLWEEEGRFVPNLSLSVLPLGDIVICPEAVRREHGDRPFHEALNLVLAHGFLHLLAWDHDTPEKERAMEERQSLLKAQLLAEAGDGHV